VRHGILKARDATLLALAVLLAVAVAAVSSGPVFAQQYPCQPSYGGGYNGCYPSSGNPYNNQYNNCQNGYYNSNCGYSGYSSPYNNYNSQYNPYNNCQSYWGQYNRCYGYGYSNPYYRPYYPYYPYYPYSPYNNCGYWNNYYYGSCYYRYHH
jgi:hypothetical protein